MILIIQVTKTMQMKPMQVIELTEIENKYTTKK